MPTTTCVLCGTSGFVRSEMVIKAGLSRREYYCGRCEGRWQSDETGDSPKREPAGRRPGSQNE